MKTISLGSFLNSSVTWKTKKAYEGHWQQWCKFLVEELGETEPLLADWPEQQESIAVALFLQNQHQKGLREKQVMAWDTLAFHSCPPSHVIPGSISDSRGAGRVSPYC